jgi:hypothetical protein
MPEIGGGGWAETVVWRAANEAGNPFSIAVLDCRGACRAFAKATEDRQSADAIHSIMNFVASFNGRSEEAETLISPCEVGIPCGGPTPVPKTSLGPQNRWLIKADAGTITARRAWTGQWVHSADFAWANDILKITRVVSDKLEVYNSTRYAVAEIEFLLSIYLAQIPAAYPIPPGQERCRPAEIAAAGWGRHGRIAEFARRI